MEKSSVVVIGFLCVMLVVVQSGLFRRTPYGLKKIKPEFVQVNGGEFSDIGSFIEQYRKQLSKRLLKRTTDELKKDTAEFVGDAFFDNLSFIEEYRERYVRDRSSAGAGREYYGLCNGVRDDVPVPSCDQCMAACANIFTKPFCTYDSVNKRAYVCTCCI